MRKDAARDAQPEPGPLELGFFSGAGTGAGAVRKQGGLVPKEVQIKTKLGNIKRSHYSSFIARYGMKKHFGGQNG